MYQWEKQRTSLATVASRVLRVERSIADVQVSLPGLSPEEASAYVCAYHDGTGIRVAVVLHLLQSDQLAFYMNSDGPLDSEAAGNVLGDGLSFAESLGFTLGDLDFRRLSKDDHEELWSSLAFFMAKGQVRKVVAAPVTPALAVTQSPPTPAVDVAKATVGSLPLEQPEPTAASRPTAQPKPRTTVPRSAVRRLPSVEEMQHRRKAFIQNLGRLLGML